MDKIISLLFKRLFRSSNDKKLPEINPEIIQLINDIKKRDEEISILEKELAQLNKLKTNG